MAVENFSTYTEVDSGTYITVSDSRVTWTQYPNNADNYVYKDKVADHFNGDFEHLLTLKTASSNNLLIAAWMLGNAVNDVTGVQPRLMVYIYNDKIRIHEYSGASYDGTSYSYTADNIYYLKINRNEAVGTYGTLYLYIYSDVARTTLLKTDSVTLHEKVDWRYIFVAASYNGLPGPASDYVENLDLQEAVATNFQVNISDTWKDVASIQINIGGVWKNVTKVELNIADTWKTIFEP